MHMLERKNRSDVCPMDKFYTIHDDMPAVRLYHVIVTLQLSISTILMSNQKGLQNLRSLAASSFTSVADKSLTK